MLSPADLSSAVPGAEAVARALAAHGIHCTGDPVALGRHADRPVLRFPTTAGAVVVKLFADEATAVRSHRTRTALWASWFGAPRSIPRMPEPLLLLGRCAAIVDRYVPGGRLPGDDPTALRPALGRVAALLADLHGSGADLPVRRDAAGVVRSMHRKAADLRSTALGAAAGAVAALVDDGLAHLTRRPVVPTHGDAGPDNVLVSGRQEWLIDWDRAALADPARDLTQFGATVWSRAIVLGRSPSWSTFEDLVTAYAQRRPPPPAAVLDVYRAAALLRNVHGWSAFRRSPALAVPLLAEARRLGSLGES